MKWTATFTVEGHGRFPFDMLRYDSCHPVHESEARRLAVNVDSNDYLKKRQVTLRRYGATAGEAGRITAARWESFTWHVVEGSLKTEKR